jgi:hypothetical protein
MKTNSSRVVSFLCLAFFLSLDYSAVFAADQKIKVSIVIEESKLKIPTGPGTINGIAGIPSQDGSLGSVTLKSGDAGKMESVREFPYPIGFDPVVESTRQTPDGKMVDLVIPITPTGFKTENVGWTIALAPTLDKGLVQLAATATYTSLIPHQGAPLAHAVYGENSGPVYKDVPNPKTGKVNHVLITPNQADLPVFQKSITPFFVFAKPGKEYKIKLQCGSDWVDATVKCELM